MLLLMKKTNTTTKKMATTPSSNNNYLFPVANLEINGVNYVRSFDALVPPIEFDHLNQPLVAGAIDFPQVAADLYLRDNCQVDYADTKDGSESFSILPMEIVDGLNQAFSETLTGTVIMGALDYFLCHTGESDYFERVLVREQGLCQAIATMRLNREHMLCLRAFYYTGDDGSYRLSMVFRRLKTVMSMEGREAAKKAAWETVMHKCKGAGAFEKLDLSPNGKNYPFVDPEIYMMI